MKTSKRFIALLSALAFAGVLQASAGAEDSDIRLAASGELTVITETVAQPDPGEDLKSAPVKEEEKTPDEPSLSAQASDVPNKSGRNRAQEMQEYSVSQTWILTAGSDVY